MHLEDFGARAPREGIDEDFLRRIIEEGEGDGTACRLGEQTRVSRRGRRYADTPTRCARTADCGCTTSEEAEHANGWGLVGYPLAMVYAPVQSFCDLYEIEDGWRRGTIFSELDLPLGEIPSGKQGGCRG